jgi:hypothetical protein
MMDLGQPLDNLLLKVMRAKEQILNLEAERDSFVKTKPYGFRFETNPKTRHREGYLTYVNDIPARLSLPIGDALNNLRSALDHTAYHLVCVGTKRRERFPHAKFPTGETAEKYRTERERAVQGMRQDAIDAIDATEPYGGGAGEILWHLAALNNFDKHRLLVPAWSTFEGHTAIKSDRALLARFRGGAPMDHAGTVMAARIRLCPVKAGDKIIDVPESEMDEYVNYILGVAFAEPEVVRGKSVFDVLHEIRQLVQAIIFRFDKMGLYV